MFCAKCGCKLTWFHTYGSQPYCGQCSKEIEANKPKSVIIKFEKEIENCHQCPFTCGVREQGCSYDICSKLGNYADIPDKGIRPDCPFRK